MPSIEPSIEPSVQPSVQPSIEPSVQPSVEPLVEPETNLYIEPKIESIADFLNKYKNELQNEKTKLIQTNKKQNQNSKNKNKKEEPKQKEEPIQIEVSNNDIQIDKPQEPIIKPKTKTDVETMCEMWLEEPVRANSNGSSSTSEIITIEEMFEKMNKTVEDGEDSFDFYNKKHIKQYNAKPKATIVDILCDKNFEREGKLFEINNSLNMCLMGFLDVFLVFGLVFSVLVFLA
jgi:hypothetical protein